MARGDPGLFDDEIARERELAKAGDSKAARVILNRVIPLLRARGPSTILCKGLNDLSLLETAVGNYAAAERTAEEARGVGRMAGDPVGEGRALDSRGIANLMLGNYSEAQSSFRGALALARAVQDKQAEVQYANNLGSTYFYQGAYTQALREYEGAASLATASAGQVWSAEWAQVSAINIATLYQRVGQFGKALRIYRSVRDSGQNLSPADQAQVFSNLGALYRHLGDPYKAIESYNGALRLLRQQHNVDEEIGVRVNVGTIYALDWKDLERAARSFREVLAIAEKHRNKDGQAKAHVYLGETLIRQEKPESARSEFAIAIASGTTEDRWQAQYGLGRAELLLGNQTESAARFAEAVGTIESMRGHMDSVALKSEFLADKRDVYDAAIGLATGGRNLPELFRLIESSRSRNFQDRLTRDASPRLEQVQARLDAETLLLEFWQGPNQIAVLWVTREACGIARSPMPVSELMRIASSLPDSASRIRGLFPENFAPFARGSLKHVLVAPDGLLGALPLELAEISGDSMLIDRFDVAYLPSSQLLFRPPGGGVWWRWPWERQMVAFGAPLAQANSAIVDDSVSALPGSEVEIQGIARMLPGRAETFLGSRDTRSAFLGGAATSAQILHVSSHAFSDTTNPENTRLLFTADYVYLRELQAMDLKGVDLATMSACDTERGKLIRGEGTQAFSRALLGAGCRSTITTLWRIEDAPAAEFMKQFYYFAAVKGKTKAEALRSAKLKFLRSGTAYAAPRHWAAFVLNGDPGRLSPVFLSWTELGLGLAAILVIIAVRLMGPAMGPPASRYWPRHLRLARASAPRGRASLPPTSSPTPGR